MENKKDKNILPEKIFMLLDEKSDNPEKHWFHKKENHYETIKFLTGNQYKKSFEDIKKHLSSENSKSSYSYPNDVIKKERERKAKKKMLHVKSHYQNLPSYNGYKWFGFENGKHLFKKKEAKGYSEIKASETDLTNGNIEFMTEHGLSNNKMKSGGNFDEAMSNLHKKVTGEETKATSKNKIKIHLNADDRFLIKQKLNNEFGKNSSEYYFDKNEITTYSIKSESKIERTLSALKSHYSYEKNKKDSADYQVVFALSKVVRFEEGANIELGGTSDSSEDMSAPTLGGTMSSSMKHGGTITNLKPKDIIFVDKFNNKEFVIKKIFKNKDNETCYSGNFIGEKKEHEFILSEKDKYSKGSNVDSASYYQAEYCDIQGGHGALGASSKDFEKEYKEAISLYNREKKAGELGKSTEYIGVSGDGDKFAIIYIEKRYIDNMRASDFKEKSSYEAWMKVAKKVLETGKPQKGSYVSKKDKVNKYMSSHSVKATEKAKETNWIDSLTDDEKHLVRSLESRRQGVKLNEKEFNAIKKEDVKTCIEERKKAGSLSEKGEELSISILNKIQLRKSKEASKVLQLMDEDYSYIEALKKVLNDNKNIDKKKLEEELSDYI